MPEVDSRQQGGDDPQGDLSRGDQGAGQGIGADQQDGPQGKGQEREPLLERRVEPPVDWLGGGEGIRVGGDVGPAGRCRAAGARLPAKTIEC